MAATLADPLLGHLIDGRYEVLSRIARGGMATVYLASDRRLDREVAIKVMHPHLAEGGAGSEFIARFRREARAAARLTHPGLVGVFDQGVDGETSYLTMEYIDGTNLRRHLGERGSLSVEEAFATIESVLDALGAVHRAGLVHRDVKPENILLAADGRIKVADFGLARAVTEVTATTAGTVLGTVAYLAPELVAHGSSDARTDVYAIGILLYEMLTGAQPFTGSTPIEVAFKHVNSDIPAPSDAVPWLPVEVDELVQALAARNPDDRPADAAASLHQLRRTRAALDEGTLARRADVAPSITLPQATAGHQGSVPEESHPASENADGGPTTDGAHAGGVAGVLPSAGRRHPADLEATESLHVPRPRSDPTTGGAWTTHGSTVALRIGTGVDEAAPGADPTTPPAPRRRRRRWPLVAGLVLLLAALGAGGWWYMSSGPGAYTSVPTGLVGVDLVNARAVLTEAGLVAAPTEAFDPVVPQGTVLDVNPDEGARVAKEGTVDLVVSKGPDLRVVPPDLVGQPVEAVVAALTEAGFVVPEPERTDDDVVEAGRVLSVSAEAGAQLPKDTEVTLVVSSGPAPLTIPGVIGLAKDDAVAQLVASGLTVVADATDYSEEHAAGLVMAQDPAPQAAGFRTNTVTLTVSLGPPLVEVPRLIDSRYEEAKATLEGLGFVVAREQIGVGILNRVWDQSVAPGQTAPKGSTITLTVV